MTHRFQINLRGIIDLLSNHLYSRPEIFIRELLQNAVDAITARQQREPNHSGEITLAVTSPRGKPPTLEVTDNGIGLTEDEIHRFLATIGETSKRDAEGRRTGDFLGQFGIGLLSCFVVSNEIVVVTRSVRDNSPAVEWRGQADGTYAVRSPRRRPCPRYAGLPQLPSWQRGAFPQRLHQGSGASLRRALALSHPGDDQPNQRRRQRARGTLASRVCGRQGPDSGALAVRQANLRISASWTRSPCTRGWVKSMASPSSCHTLPT